jgi:hypothetical protein
VAANGDRDDDQDKGGDRESIWSVARGALGYYFALFATLVLAGVALLIWKADLPDGDLATRVLFVWQESGSIVIPSAGYAIIILEGARLTMVLAGMFEAKLKRQREKDLAEARREAYAKSRDWYARMREAEAKGEPFDEPPPFEADANGKEPRA